jgi:hypothetical protein
MGSRRIGTARVEALLNKLKSEDNRVERWKGNFKYVSSTGNKDFSDLQGDTTIMVNVAMADTNYIRLPEATTSNGGMHIRVALGIACLDKLYVGTVTSNLIGAASAVGDTNEANAPTDIATAIADVGDTFKRVEFDLDTAAKAGGTGGTVLDFYYTGASNVIIYRGDLISEIDDPTLATHFVTTTIIA